VFENKLLIRYLKLRPECNRQMEIFKDVHDLYLLPNKIRVIKSQKMRWTGYVAHMGDKRNVYRVYVGNLRERNSLKT
jgi:hypothetical protein